MKKLIVLLLFIPLVFSCSNMESDAEKVCDLTTLIIDVKRSSLSPKQLDELEADIKIMGAEIENIKVKYDEDEFQAYLLENCEGFKKIIEMGEALQGIGDSFDNN